ncbi:GTPase domain-containing protein [Ramlibacter sp. PS3R-8]|uniref:Rab family GTPase n=1 Tax=Ramlibacter sp. PS3R-8 TaxID=3133437 RepID=UPI0030A60096
MSFWKAFAAVAKKIAMSIVGKEAINAIRSLPAKAREWWYGKKICVIGPTGAGKNSFYSRLRQEAVPTEHIQTRGVEKLESFDFVQTLPDGTLFKLRCKRSVNVGGEIDERDRHWWQACEGADVVFYLIDAEKVLDENAAAAHRNRVVQDLQWLATRLGRIKEHALVHLLVNKVDAVATKQEQLQKYVSELERSTKAVFGPYFKRVTGVTPTSMVDDYVFNTSFAGALESIYHKQTRKHA